MDFGELNFGMKSDESVYNGKRAVFDDADDDNETLVESNTNISEIKNDSVNEPAVIDNDVTVLDADTDQQVISIIEPVMISDEIPEESTDSTFFSSEEIIRETGEFDFNTIEGAPYSRNGGRPVHHKEIKKQLYGSTAVSKILGLSTQAIRNYCDYFEDYLQIQKKESGHREFTHDDIERLRQLLKIKDEKNLTFEQLKEYLNGPEHFEVIPESQRFESAIEKMEHVFEASLKSAIAYVIDSNSKLIEKKDEETQKLVSGMAEQLKNQDEAINKLIEVIRDEKTAADNALNSTVEQLQETLKERDKRINELMKLTEQQNDKITELETKKQKKFFGLF